MAGSPNPAMRQNYQAPQAQQGQFMPSQNIASQLGFLRSRLGQQQSPYQSLGYGSRLQQPISGINSSISSRIAQYKAEEDRKKAEEAAAQAAANAQNDQSG
jgi:hypothetical protein